jgi:hypothetical protein
VKIASTNQQIQTLIVELLTQCNFTGILTRKDGIVLRNYDNILQFQQEIGFLEEALVKRGNFKGLTKNKMLNLAVTCKKRSRKESWINTFNTKEQIMKEILSYGSNL